jgi:hypothetical protein
MINAILVPVACVATLVGIVSLCVWMPFVIRVIA